MKYNNISCVARTNACWYGVFEELGFMELGHHVPPECFRLLGDIRMRI